MQGEAEQAALVEVRVTFVDQVPDVEKRRAEQLAVLDQHDSTPLLDDQETAVRRLDHRQRLVQARDERLELDFRLRVCSRGNCADGHRGRKRAQESAHYFLPHHRPGADGPEFNRCGRERKRIQSPVQMRATPRINRHSRAACPHRPGTARACRPPACRDGVVVISGAYPACMRSLRREPADGARLHPAPGARTKMSPEGARRGYPDQDTQPGLRLPKKALTPSCASGCSQASARAAIVRSTISSSMRGPRLRARRFEAATAPGAQAR